MTLGDDILELGIGYQGSGIAMSDRESLPQVIRYFRYIYYCEIKNNFDTKFWCSRFFPFGEHTGWSSAETRPLSTLVESMGV